jgi:hypothetical protein
LETDLADTVDVTIPVDADVAKALESRAHREAAGRYLSKLLKDGSVAEILADAGPESSKNRRHAFHELDQVTLAEAVYVTELERELPVGASGTVVGIWQNGRAYEVEFSQPFECLVTVPSEGLKA